jgi:uncharacterized protein
MNEKGKGKGTARPPSFMRETGTGVTVELYIQPRASRNEMAGLHQGSLKLRLTAPPVEGEANRECIRFLADLLEVPRSQLRLMQGHKARRKTVLIEGLTAHEVHALLSRKGLLPVDHGQSSEVSESF